MSPSSWTGTGAGRGNAAFPGSRATAAGSRPSGPSRSPPAISADEVARLEPGEADLDPPGGLRSDHHDPASLGGALVDQQPGRPGPLDDRPGDPADFGPDTVHHRTAGEAAPDNGMIALPQGRGRNGPASPGLRGGGQRKPLFPPCRLQDQNVRADVQDPSGDRVHQRSFCRSYAAIRCRYGRKIRLLLGTT